METIEILRECAAGKRGHGDTMDLVADEFGCPVPVHSYVLGYVADAIEKELKERYMELPVDADGVPIHVGDEMDCGEHFGVQEAEGFIHGAVAFTVCDPQPARICTCPAHMTRHYHKPTVEDVLRDFAIACEDAGNAGDTVNRLISEYAEKLQLKEESE